MKILLLSRAPLNYLGGIPVYLKNLYLQDVSNQLSISILSLSSSLDSSQKRVLKIRHSENLFEEVYPSFWVSHTLSFSFAYIFNTFRQSLRFDLVHIQDPDPISALLALLLSLFLGKQYVVTWHASVLYKIPSILRPLYRLFQDILYSRASKVFFFTRSHYKSFLSEYSPLPQDSLVFCSMPSPSYYAPALSKVDQDSCFTLIFIGRLVEYKGVAFLLEALKLVKSSIRLYIIGTGPLLDQFRKLACSPSLLHHSIIFTESIDDNTKKYYLNNSHVLVLPSVSQSEALGIVQLEAMSCSLPIINTLLNNGVNEIAPDTLCALTVKPSCPVSLANAINTISKNSELYSLLSRGAFSQYRLLSSGSNLLKFLSFLPLP